MIQQISFFLLHLTKDAPKIIHELLALSGLYKLRHRVNFSRLAHLDLPLGQGHLRHDDGFRLSDALLLSGIVGNQRTEFVDGR